MDVIPSLLILSAVCTAVGLIGTLVYLLGLLGLFIAIGTLGIFGIIFGPLLVVLYDDIAASNKKRY